MSQTPDNILFIPIQINGGATVPPDLLDRELFIKDGVLHVGTGSGESEVIIGRVIPGAEIENAVLKGTLKLDASLIKTPDTLPTSGVVQGQVYFVDEGIGYNT